MATIIAPSVLSADFLHLERDIQMLNGSEAGLIHLDVMDGNLVPNISFGFPVCEAISKVAEKPLDAHLMVANPLQWFDVLRDMGVNMVSFHYETAGWRSGKLIDELHRRGIKAGVAIDPDVKVSRLFPYVDKADFFLIMSVFAGFGGQKFIYESLDRISELKERITRKNSDALIEVDGGVNLENAAALKEAGADILVAGSTVFNSVDPLETIKALKEA